MGIGMALKVVDGNGRAVPPAAAALLAKLGALGGAEYERLHPFTRRTVRNTAGRVVGEIVALL
jgi:L-asparaginase II